jgi:hypothetical protein
LIYSIYSFISTLRFSDRAESHRQPEVGGQTGDAQAALAAVKLEREKLLKELGRLYTSFETELFLITISRSMRKVK